MHRFRKRSDAKRTQVPNIVPNAAQPPQSESFELLPELPPASDFRTSLILPDLTRRFTLLRNQAGDPLTLEDLRNRLAEQRARGVDNQITEEEEDMILETLGRIRANNSNDRGSSQESVEKSDAPSSRYSGRATDPDTSSLSGSLTSSPSTRSTTRYSNTLYGSGRIRDYNSSRNGSSPTFKAGSMRSTQSFTPTDSSQSLKNTSIYSDDKRSPTPDSPPVSFMQSTPEKSRSPALTGPPVYGFQPTSTSDSLSTRALGASALKRASLALERAIQELEEEGDEEILLPRTTPVTRHGIPEAVAHSAQPASFADSTVEAGMAISVDRQVRAPPETHRVSPVPSRVAPGYIPGMPRPMTPRDHMDSEELRSHSTTPRASSPTMSSFSEAASNIPTGILRRDTRNQPSSRPISPLTSAFPTNGHHSPENGYRSTDNFTEFDNPSNSTLLTRRRPASPLAGPPFQPMAVSSRPSTPSNITWTSPPATSKSSGHTRNGSWNTSFTGSTSSMPFLPEQRSFSPLTGIDIGTPVSQNSYARSPTPTQSVSRSPLSPMFPNFDSSSRNASRRSSRQNAPSSPMSPTKFPSLGFAPLASSSRSSLESTGSSYHSWEDSSKDRSFDFFNELDPSQRSWHDIPPNKSSSTTPGGSPNDDFDMEDIIARYAGLQKSDFMAIQDKLVSVALAKGTASDTRERTSSLRRRRPSTSQSNYSVGGPARIASPPPQSQPSSPSTAAPSNIDQANALLNSVVNSIQPSAPLGSPVAPVVERTPSKQSERDISPTTRRNRDLAQVLFGESEEGKDAAKSPSAPPSAAVATSPAAEPPLDSPQKPSVLPMSPTMASQMLQRNPSTTRLPQSPEAHAELEREVQRKTDAAMLALKKSPSQTNLNNGTTLLASNSVSRRRISPNQISTPKLVSASTSVDTIPLRSPSVNSGNFSGPSKISQRFRRFRGTLRSKPQTPLGGEITPFLLDSSNPSASPTGQTATYDPATFSEGRTVPASATEFGKAKVLVPSPPASAGPGLKGFMARFRSKQRIPETHPEIEPQTSPQLTAARAGPAIARAHQSTPSASSQAKDLDMASKTPLASPRTPTAMHTNVAQPHAEVRDSAESAALKQLFDAASNLGLDQNALSDLLRSASTSSRTGPRTPAQRKVIATQATLECDEPVESQSSPASAAPRPSVDSQRPRPSVDSQRPVDLSKKGSVRRNLDSHLRPSNGQDASNPVVRRTLIFPSDSRSSTFDPSALLRKSSSRRKRASAQSYSSRSVHDRVPTPPPARSGARRFSTDPSPPIPHLPASLPSQGENSLPVPPFAASSGDKSVSAYESLYDMYASEKGVSTAPSEATARDPLQRHDTPINAEAGTALELIEFANGETIWSIVNGLRDDDLDSPYASRSSFASDYSTRENGEGGVQLFFKEHNRASSKGSASSFLSRKKSLGTNRPETKVFYSSPTQIGRLIEDLSLGMDSGSFNIMPHAQSTTSSVSEAHWTMEERLEHMLGSIAK
ncbi:hypothetical protein HGRIS_013211 [Hohenbuehelia grisea]|uniref:Uncharacterized protein n=1 Tax=Hohenbuehelia grisea TaxID=104357 RepID=A0ABR3IV15_9AGAR